MHFWPKEKKWEWTDSCDVAFKTLKHKLVSAPILSYPDPNIPFILTCDASDTSVGYVLGQLNDDNKEHVIAYGGKSLSADQRKFTTTEKECLVVFSGIEAYRPYLVHGKFTVVTDHKALVWLQTAKHTGRLERWALKIQEYCFQLCPGKSNCVADALSRRPYTDSEVSNQTICYIGHTDSSASHPMECHNFVHSTLEEENEEKCPLAVYFGYSENP